jgi:hypothetical protein
MSTSHNLNSYIVWSEDKGTKSVVRMASVHATSRGQARRHFIKYDRPHIDTAGVHHSAIKVCVQDPEW